MANGLQKLTGCDVAICTTGIAGPTGGTKEKPVGLVYISVKYNNIVTIKEIKLPPNTPRKEMKEQFANHALKLALDILT
jgi:nicotinamide mononucleotide (NMN) deamidase PncC